jgi:euchromatic histone-lysine N-methyltransferase
MILKYAPASCWEVIFWVELSGINVGHRFYSRAEMVAVGFHSHWLNGIDYMGQFYKKGVSICFICTVTIILFLSYLPWQ